MEALVDLSTPKIMGILNVTPDSFSDGGKFSTLKKAKARVHELIAEGADIIDIGGESTRPDSKTVLEHIEMKRVCPIIDYVRGEELTDRAVFSIDTYKASVARYAVDRGFQMVNDVTALRGDYRMLDTLIRYKPYVVMMYSKDKSAQTTRDAREYGDVMTTIMEFLVARIELLVKYGFPKEKIIVDPGWGLFVSPNQTYSFEIIERLSELTLLGCPIMIGISRKSHAGASLTLEERDMLSAELSMKAIANGASIIRTHNVALMKRVLQKTQ